MSAYVVLHTVRDGRHITHLPTDRRILAEYGTGVAAADHARRVCDGRNHALPVARADLWVYAPTVAR